MSHAAVVNNSGRVEALRARHALLAKRLEEVQARPGFSDAEILQLKKQKLRVKDELETTTKH